MDDSLFNGYVSKKKPIKGDDNQLIYAINKRDKLDQRWIYIRKGDDILDPKLIKEYDNIVMYIDKETSKDKINFGKIKDYYIQKKGYRSPLIIPGTSIEYVEMHLAGLIRPSLKKYKIKYGYAYTMKDIMVNQLKVFIKEHEICNWLTVNSSNYVNDFNIGGIKLLLEAFLTSKVVNYKTNESIIQELFKKWYDNHNMRLFKMIGVEREFIDNYLKIYGYNEVYERIMTCPFNIPYIPHSICTDIVDKFMIHITDDKREMKKIEAMYLFLHGLTIKRRNAYTFKYNSLLIPNVNDRESFVRSVGGQTIVNMFNLRLFDDFFTLDIIFDTFKKMKIVVDLFHNTPIDDIVNDTYVEDSDDSDEEKEKEEIGEKSDNDEQSAKEGDREDEENDSDDEEEEIVRDVIKEVPILINYGADKQQELALDLMLNNRISCIYGGAGTGKTTTISRSLAMFSEKTFKTVHIVAYTGKAVSRIHQSLSKLKTKTMCNTIHKYMVSGPTLHGPRTAVMQKMETQLRKKAVAAIIIDEASMVDIHLFTKFLLYIYHSYKHELPRIILVGDPNQLQPIDFGTPFVSLLKLYPKVELKTNHRSGSMLNFFLNLMVNENRYPRIGKGNFNLETYYDSSEDKVKEIVKKLKKQGVEHKDITIIYPYVAEIKKFNNMVKEVYFEGTDQQHLVKRSVSMDNDSIFMKVYDSHRFMMTSNDYTINVMNGEEGFVVLKGKTAYLSVNNHIVDYEILFTQDTRSVQQIKPDDSDSDSENDDSNKNDVVYIRDLVEAWAITVHKSQGSEWDHVIVYIPRCTSFISRELLYTAMSRARTKLYLVTDVSYAVMKKHMDKEFIKSDKKKTEIELLEYIDNIDSENEDGETCETYDSESEDDQPGRVSSNA